MADVMEQIRHLLARAEHPNTPPEEADTALRRANTLMARHAIDEALLRIKMTDSEKRKPVVEKWHWAESYTEFGPYLRTMLAKIAEANNCRAVIGTSAPFNVTMVGMKDDVDWCQMLYTNCFLTFITKLEPKWDTSLPEAQNIYNFKVAGKVWWEIWVVMVTTQYGIDYNDIHWEYSQRSGRIPAIPYWGSETMYRDMGAPCEPHSKGYQYLFRAYKREAKRRGDANVVETQRHDAYRRSFAEGFAGEIEHRLWQMSEEAKGMQRETTGAELALRDSWEDVEAAFYEEFPNLHPDAIKKRQLEVQADTDARRRREREHREAMLAAMTERQRADFLEKEERKRRRDMKSNARYWEDYDRKNATDHSGARLGRDAAKGVSLTRTTPVGRDDKKEIGQ